MAYRGVKEYLESQGLLYSPKFEDIWEHLDFLPNDEHKSVLDREQEWLDAGSVNDPLGSLGWTDQQIDMMENPPFDYLNQQAVIDYARGVVNTGWDYITSQGLDSKSRIAAAEKALADFEKQSQALLANQHAKEAAAQKLLAEKQAGAAEASRQADIAKQLQQVAEIRRDNVKGLSRQVGVQVTSGLDVRENRNAVQFKTAQDQNRATSAQSTLDLSNDESQKPRKTRRGLSNSLGLNL